MQIWLILGSIFGFLAVAIGAFGAHSLEDILSEYGEDIFKTALIYHMFHSLALILTGVVQKAWPDALFGIAGWAFSIGILIFSGSLYILAVTEIKWIGAITPIGGISFLIGWVWLLIQFVRIK